MSPNHIHCVICNAEVYCEFDIDGDIKDGVVVTYVSAFLPAGCHSAGLDDSFCLSCNIAFEEYQARKMDFEIMQDNKVLLGNN